MTTIPRGFKRWVMGVGERLRGGARDERGAVAVFFAVAIVVLAPLALGVVDIYMTSSQRSRLQDALDAAALYTARSGATDADEIQAIGLRALLANLSDADEARLIDTNFELSDSTVVASAEMSSRSLVADLWSHGNMTVSTNVVRSSVNLEVALVLDITGSMGMPSTKIEAAKDAAEELIDLVVQDVQTPYYSKLALVPFSNSVDVGSAYSESVRGAIPGGVVISSMSKSNGVITVTSANHGFAKNKYVVFEGTGTSLDGNAYKITSKTVDTFKFSSNANISGYDNGSVYCSTYGCRYYRFENADGDTNLYKITDCVSERIGTYKYTDTAPSTATVGLVYGPTSGSFCPSATITPMTTDKDALKAAVENYSVTGSTAGHIGIAWGWYLVSPNFGYLWPSASRPAAYGTDELLKVVVIMTDGDFNTAYCNGVVAQDSGSGSGSDSAHINCNATNASSFAQATSLCANMKAQDIVVYTVGFDVSEGSSAAEIMEDCATDAEHHYLPSSGAELQDAFRAIAQDINSLRLSH